MNTKILIVGACGKMGREIVRFFSSLEGYEIVGAVDVLHGGKNLGKEVFGMENGILIRHCVIDGLSSCHPDVVIDFTQPSAIYDSAKMYLYKGVKSVIGTTGLSEQQVDELRQISEREANNTAMFIAPNFSIGAVLLMQLSKIAARYFCNAEVLEIHHNQKKDAPSGTALQTAIQMAHVRDDFSSGNCREQETLFNVRGGMAPAGIHIHSLRIPGYNAYQSVYFGGMGQRLTLSHEAIDRSCYMEGIKLAVDHTCSKGGFHYGLESIMNF